MSRPAIFLDRDGVIIENRSRYARSWDDVAIYGQAVDALRLLAPRPEAIIIVTNQSGVARGNFTLATANAINDRLVAMLRDLGCRIDAVYLCPHHPDERCACRKPQPGMLLQAAADHDLDLAQSIMVGDALTDVQAGQNAGVKEAVLVQTGRGKEQLALPERASLPPFTITPSLHAYVSPRGE